MIRSLLYRLHHFYHAPPPVAVRPEAVVEAGRGATMEHRRRLGIILVVVGGLAAVILVGVLLGESRCSQPVQWQELLVHSFCTRPSLADAVHPMRCNSHAAGIGLNKSPSGPTNDGAKPPPPTNDEPLPPFDTEPPPPLPPLTDLPAGRGLDWSRAGFRGEGMYAYRLAVCMAWLVRQLMTAPPPAPPPLLNS